MRQIEKQTEPEAFIAWKKANKYNINRLATDKDKTGDDLWKLLPSSLSKDAVAYDYCKELLRQSLVTEQFHLCCYCNSEIKGLPLDTKVEHFLPKETYKEKAFHYGNLFAACNGGERVRPVELSCDSHKGYKDPKKDNILSPLLENVHSHFSYKENGEIIGKTNEGKNAIHFLNLACKRLNLSRKAVIEDYIYDESKDIQELIEEVSTPVNGKLQPFCMAILDILYCYR